MSSGIQREQRWWRRGTGQAEHIGAAETHGKRDEVDRRWRRGFRPADTSLIRLLVRAQKVGARLFATGSPTLEDIALEENITASYASRIVRLTFLAPDIVAAILAGRQPPELTANKLMADTRLPLDWRGQRTALGFA